MAENPQPSFLERYGLHELRRWNRCDAWAVHPLANGEIDRLRRLERWTLVRAALAGVVSGGVLGGAEVLTDGRMGTFDFPLWREQWPTWTVYVGLVVVVSVAEIVFLYWNAIRGAGHVSAAAGLPVAGHETGEQVARALVRAALELPNPRERICGVDPYARTPRWRLTVLALAYKVKVGATSFIVRILLRRLLGRAALRTLIPLAAIPVYAVWNAVVTAWVMRAARVRAFGPLAVRDLAEFVGRSRTELGPDCRRLIVQGVAEAVVRTGDADPNFHLLMRQLMETLAVTPTEEGVTWASAQKSAGDLTERERDVFLAVLAVAVMIDGRVRRTEATLLEEAHRLCGRPYDRAQLKRMLAAFLEGRGIPIGAV